jgi:type 1 glutamine amidotransferase
MIERLCDKYRINVAIRPQSTPATHYRSPTAVLKVCEKRGKRIGACGDLGLWIRAGVKPVDALRVLKDRVLTVRLADLSEFGAEAREVAWGTGVADLGEFIKETYRLELEPTLWTVQQPSVGDSASAEIARSIEFFHKTIIPIADYHRSYAARTKGIRRLGDMSPEERRKIEAAIPATAPAVARKPRKLLVVDLTVDRHGHPSIPYANLAVALMEKQTGAYEAVFSSDRSMLKPEKLKQFDAVFLNNTLGPIFDTPELREGFAAFISGGGGLVANHAATVTSTDWPELGKILGARGAAHRESQEKVTVELDDPESPLCAAFGGKGFEFADEFFRFQEPYSREKVHVLMSIDVDKTDMNQGRSYGKCFREDNDYPISWIHRYGKGRVFYCSMGHNPYVFWDSRILEHFLAAIQFALGDLEADTTPSAKLSGR